MIRDLLIRNRSYRRFDESVCIDPKQIEQWIDAARYTASMRNVQPLKYIIVTDTEVCAELCSRILWAGYLKDWDGPGQGERPTAFIIQLLDTSIATSARFDEGLQLQAITLSATEEGLGCCIFQTFSVADLSRYFELPEHLCPTVVVAVGKPAEQVMIEEINPEGDIHYYRDDQSVHHVPKRSIAEVIVRQI